MDYSPCPPTPHQQLGDYPPLHTGPKPWKKRLKISYFKSKKNTLQQIQNNLKIQ